MLDLATIERVASPALPRLDVLSMLVRNWRWRRQVKERPCPGCSERVEAAGRDVCRDVQKAKEAGKNTTQDPIVHGQRLIGGVFWLVNNADGTKENLG